MTDTELKRLLSDKSVLLQDIIRTSPPLTFRDLIRIIQLIQSGEIE